MENDIVNVQILASALIKIPNIPYQIIKVIKKKHAWNLESPKISGWGNVSKQDDDMEYRTRQLFIYNANQMSN